MKTPTKLAVAFVALAGIAGAALTAQAEGPQQGGAKPGLQMAYGGDGPDRGRHGFHGKRHHGGRHMFRMMESFDGDGDGRLTQEEIDGSRGEPFSAFDGDASQTLSLEEYEKLWLDAMREVMVDRFQHLDADGDAQITAEEFKKPFAKMVRRMDRNDDGALDRDDMKRRHHREKSEENDG